MLADLRERVWQANFDLVKYGLVILTFGNVSGFDRKKGIMAIKPSGIPYSRMNPTDLVLVDLDGRIVEGKLNPSSDTPTHLALYRAFPDIGGVSHAHSEYATAFAQACREIPCLGTTHADHFNGPVPVTRHLTAAEVRDDYEANTGKVIAERFAGLNSLETPSVLVAGHGPFSWGGSAADAVKNSLVLEKIAKMAIMTGLVNPNVGSLPGHLLTKHYRRKHGPEAYYGQEKGPAPRPAASAAKKRSPR
jgi:L-ribulose-5-phosphate 4-epimerase